MLSSQVSPFILINLIKKKKLEEKTSQLHADKMKNHAWMTYSTKYKS